MSKGSQEEVRAVLPEADGKWSTLDSAGRAEQIAIKLSAACPVAQLGSPELALLKSLLSFNPAERPSAIEALSSGFFSELPPAEQPPVTAAPAPGSVDAAFAFEKETLGANELRILIANDLFRMHLEDDADSAKPVS